MSKAELVTGWVALEDALPAYLEAEEFYGGEVDEVFASEAIKRELRITGEGYRFNLIKTPVDVRTARCEISAIKVPDNEAATEAIGVVWDANDMGIYYPELIKTTLEYGDGYLMAWPIDEAQADETMDDALIVSRVEITTHDPKNVRVIYDPENARRKWFAIQRWCIPGKGLDGKETWRVNLYFADYLERWITSGSGALNEPEGWTEFSSLDTEGIPVEVPLEAHDFGEVPFFHHRTGIPYGKPVHYAGYGAQNALNKMLITQLTTSDSQGFPQRYALLDKDAVLDQDNDAPEWVDDTQATTYTTAGLSTKGGQGTTQRTGPGTFQEYAGMTEVGQFSAADPEVFLGPAAVYIRLMAQVTTTPLHYFDPSGDVPSGESLKVAEAPLVKDIQRLQLLQGGAVREEWLFILGILGVQADRVEVRWASVASATGLSDWQTIQAKIAAGVPVDQALMEAGYEPEQVATWLDADAEANTLAARVAMLSTIGLAVQSIGAGVALGVVSEQEAQLAIATVLGQVTKSGQGVDPA